MIQFGILGPLEVLAGGERLALGGRCQRAVLARLLVEPARVVSRDRLIDDVWDGRPPASAAKIVQKYVSALRKALPEPLVRTSGGGYVLDVDDDNVDARRFERLVASHQYEAGLALWRGDVLADLAGLAFVDIERARLGELRMFAIESRIEVELQAARHGALLAELAELVETNPLRERLIALRMLALYRAGRQVEALRVFDRHRRQLAEEIGVDPDSTLRELEGAILRHDPDLDLRSAPTAPERHRRGNLRLALTSFVGRGDDLESSAKAVADHRLVTMTGPGGVGKTRLALQLGAHIAGRFPGGVWVVDLAAVPPGGRVVDRVATTLRVDTRDGDDESAVAAALAHRPAALVVLDNCEHVVESAAELVAAILGCGTSTRVVATSRRPLGVDGEFVRPINPLPAADAVKLFTERARMSRSDSEIPEGEATEICRRLDGLPLAIELAASQLRVISAAEIAARLGDQLAFRGATPGRLPRQGSLREMVQWSYDLLGPEVRSTFSRLGAFASSITLEAAEAVCGGGDTLRRDVFGHITMLVDHSLLVREHVAEPPSRYRLLETLRLFALERLAEGGDLPRTRRAHADYFLVLVERGGPELWGPDERVWRLRLEADEANVRAAMDWASEHDPVLLMRLAVGLWPFFEARWHERHGHGVAVLESLLQHDIGAPEELRAWALTAVAAMGGQPGDARHAIRRGREAVGAFRRLGNDAGLAEALAALGAALCTRGRLDEAGAAVEEGLVLANHLGDARRIAPLLAVAGAVARRSEDHGRAAEHGRGELAAWRAIGSRRGEAFALRRLAVAQLHLGAGDEAARLCDRALDIWRDLDDPAGVAHVQITLADIARLSGDLAGAVDRYDAALVNLQAIGDRRCTTSTYRSLAKIAVQRGFASGERR